MNPMATPTLIGIGVQSKIAVKFAMFVVWTGPHEVAVLPS